MKKFFNSFLILLAINIPFTKSQTILNGSFENNGYQCLINIENTVYNNNMQNSTAFGPASQLDILDNSCGFGTAVDGNWFIGMAVDETDTLYDAFSLQLSDPTIIGNEYSISFYDKSFTPYNTNVVEIGLSTLSEAFGTSIYTSPIPDTFWTQRTVTFTANITAGFVTVKVVPGSYGWTHVDNFVLTNTTSVNQQNIEVSLDYNIDQNYPNPFNPSTVISYQLPVSSEVTLEVFDVLGNEVATLVNEYKVAGRYEVEFNAATLPSGVYFYQLKAEEFITTKKMILLK